jgi:hypothetical protein
MHAAIPLEVPKTLARALEAPHGSSVGDTTANRPCSRLWRSASTTTSPTTGASGA